MGLFGAKKQVIQLETGGGGGGIGFGTVVGIGVAGAIIYVVVNSKGLMKSLEDFFSKASDTGSDLLGLGDGLIHPLVPRDEKDYHLNENCAVVDKEGNVVISSAANETALGDIWEGLKNTFHPEFLVDMGKKQSNCYGEKAMRKKAKAYNDGVAKWVAEQFKIVNPADKPGLIKLQKELANAMITAELKYNALAHENPNLSGKEIDALMGDDWQAITDAEKKFQSLIKQAQVRWYKAHKETVDKGIGVGVKAAAKAGAAYEQLINESFKKPVVQGSVVLWRGQQLVDLRAHAKDLGTGDLDAAMHAAPMSMAYWKKYYLECQIKATCSAEDLDDMLKKVRDGHGSAGKEKGMVKVYMSIDDLKKYSGHFPKQFADATKWATTLEPSVHHVATINGRRYWQRIEVVDAPTLAAKLQTRTDPTGYLATYASSPNSFKYWKQWYDRVADKKKPIPPLTLLSGEKQAVYWQPGDMQKLVDHFGDRAELSCKPGEYAFNGKCMPVE